MKRTRKERRRKPMKKRETVFWIIDGILMCAVVIICIAIIMIIAKPTAAAPTPIKDNKVAAEPKTEEQVISTMKEEAIANETKVTAEAETEEEVEEVTEVTEEEVKEEEYAYSNNLTDEDVASVAGFFEEAPDIDEDAYKAFIEEYKEYLQDYDLDPDGNLLIPLSEESLRQTDDERPLASVNMGLNKNPINDAIAFPFALTEEQVGKVLAAKAGQKVDFSEEEIKQLRVELFLELGENPVLFEAWMKLITAQKIGQATTVLESWPSGKRYIELMEIARDLEPYNGLDSYADIRGRGNNIWLRKIKFDGQYKYYTTPEYQQYVLDVVLLLIPAKTDVEVLTAKAGDHYNLIPGEKNSLRFAQPANYKESLASLVFKIYTKDGKVAIKFGANLRDKRPEVLNYTVTRKPVRQSKPKPQLQPQPQPNPDPGSNNPNPNDPPKENPPEKKNPNEDPAAQGNAPIGGGTNDDPGPGPWKPDQGNSKSDKVEESQYQQGNSVNTDGANPNQYEQGPAADNTDNGSVPDTAAPSNQIGIGDGVNNNSYTDIATGQQTDGGNNHGAISAPPVD